MTRTTQRRRRTTRRISKIHGGVGADDNYNMNEPMNVINEIGLQMLEDAEEEQENIDKKIKEINEQPISMRSSQRNSVVQKNEKKKTDALNLLNKRREFNIRFIQQAEKSGFKASAISRRARGVKTHRKRKGYIQLKKKPAKKPAKQPASQPANNINVDDISTLLKTM